MNTPTLVPLPWWRVGAAWFGITALGAVVVGSFGLLYAAIDGRDEVVDAPAVVNQTLPKQATSPAVQARNHSATPR